MAELSTALHLEQRLNLSQMLSPQMQQSLHILQIPMLELRALVRQEMEQNPLLEEKEPALSISTAASVSALQSQRSANPADTADLSAPDAWDYVPSLYSREEADKRHEYAIQSIVRPTSLAEHLLEQLALSGAPKTQKRAAEEIIGNLDEHGFLRASLDEIVASARVPEKTAQRALELVQSFHPPGIGARSVQESLLIQLRQRGRAGSLESSIVSDHFELLAKRDIASLAHIVQESEERVRQAVDSIAHLQPHPASAFSVGGLDEIIQPEAAFVPGQDGSWGVRLRADQTPQLKIADQYKEMLYENNQPAEVRAYLKENMQRARGLISALEQREETLRRVLTEVARHQADFLANGPKALRPLTLRPIARALGLHETTISRAVAHKYVETPWGVWPLRKFFSSGYTTDQGQAISQVAVQKAIEEIVRQEDARKPYSDARLAEKLAEQGIHIARRTVTKYREALGILPKRLRRGK